VTKQTSHTWLLGSSKPSTGLLGSVPFHQGFCASLAAGPGVQALVRDRAPLSDEGGRSDSLQCGTNTAISLPGHCDKCTLRPTLRRCLSQNLHYQRGLERRNIQVPSREVATQRSPARALPPLSVGTVSGPLYTSCCCTPGPLQQACALGLT
jgi:hypothetical protein